MGNPVITDALETVREIDKKVQEFFEMVNDWLEWVPGALEHLIDPILRGLDALRKKVEEFWAEVQDFLDNNGEPDKLHEHADKWRDEVGKKVKTLSEPVEEQNLSTHTEWSGSGAKAYEPVVRAQGKGLEGLKSLSDELASTLDDLANAIEDLWISLGIAFGAALVGIIGAIAGGPPGWVVAVVAFGTALVMIGEAVLTIKQFMDTVDGKTKTIDTELTDLGDKWSEATPDNAKKIADPKEWEPL